MNVIKMFVLPRHQQPERKVYMKEYMREYAKTEKQIERKKQHVKDNPEKYKEYHRKYRERNLDKALFRAAKYRAKKRNIEFNITLDDVVIPDICPIFGVPLICKMGNGPGGSWDSPSIDRIDNTKGYVKGNVQVISHLANSMKSIASPQQLIMFADWIYKNFRGEI